MPSGMTMMRSISSIRACRKTWIRRISQTLSASCTGSLTNLWKLRKSGKAGKERLYDISQIDFDRLRKEFERSPAKNTVTHSLKDMIEKRLQKMLVQNPTRTDFQKHYEEIVADYNSEKDRATIERTFEALLKLAASLSEEEKRAVKEGLDEESLALFDLLLKPELSKQDIKRIKKVAEGLYKTLQAEFPYSGLCGKAINP